MNLRDNLKSDLASAVLKLGVNKAEVLVGRESDGKHGDYSSNIALQLAKQAKLSPKELAGKLASELEGLPYLEKVEVAEPGFLNFIVKDEVWQKQIGEIVAEENKFGSNDSGKGKKARIEFVSANPTGPLHFGNARGGPIGDVLASVLGFCGYQVFREYYHNDIGVQVKKLGESILNVAKGAKLEDQEYKGEYIIDLAREVGKVANASEVGEKAVKLLLNQIINDCRAIGIDFDKVYSESEFIESGKTKQVLEGLKQKGFIKEQEKALWFAPIDDFLKDRETVVVKSDGTFTYFASDIAYHKLKFEEGYDLVIDVFGANHHGHVPRLQAAVAKLGFDVSRFHVILYQWVRFMKGKELAKMSKRAGTMLTARDVLDAVGKDALRFFILMRDVNSYIDFDLDLAREKSSKNPVYYVQYAHARISSILQKADGKTETREVKYELLTTSFELDLIKQITRFPEIVEDISTSFAVHQLTTYARELADSFHVFYENCRVLEEDEDLSRARLALCASTQIALKNTLTLLGISAPEKM